MANKPRLPRARPFLDVLLALNGGANVIVSLEIDQVVKPYRLVKPMIAPVRCS